MKFSKLLLLKTILFLYACTNKNEMELDFSNPLKKEDFKIEIQILGSDVNRKVIYDGNIIYDIPNEYGENDWHFNYKDSLYGYFRHFKNNRNDKHNYTFHFFQKENNIFAEIKINGASKELKTISFTKNKKDFR
jgi:hypothetical protein